MTFDNTSKIVHTVLSRGSTTPISDLRQLLINSHPDIDPKTIDAIMKETLLMMHFNVK